MLSNNAHVYNTKSTLLSTVLLCTMFMNIKLTFIKRKEVTFLCAFLQ